MKTHYIVLNGKRYDANTGELINPVVTSPNKLDLSDKTIEKPMPAISPNETLSITAKQVKRQAAVQISPHKPQPGKTLVRRTVKPASTPELKTIKTSYPVQKSSSAPNVIKPKLSVNNISLVRLNRSKSVPKSSKIGRFNHQPIIPIQPQIMPISVAETPLSFNHHTTILPTTKKHSAGEVEILHKSSKAKTPNSNLFEQALANAKSHENTYIAPKRKKATKKYIVAFPIITLVATTTLLGMAFRQDIEAQVASVRAGFSVERPSFIPSGYKHQATAVAGKAVSINYISPQDRTSYSLTQEISTWNSSTLLSSVSAKTNGNYRVLFQAGQTIFIYDNNKATWVDSGILYTITGDAPLTADQITSIASSL